MFQGQPATWSKNSDYVCGSCGTLLMVFHKAQHNLSILCQYIIDKHSENVRE